VTASQSAENAVFNEFMSPTQAASAPKTAAPAVPANASHGGGKHGHSGGGASAPGLMVDVSDGVAQAKALGPIGIPIYYPKLIRSSSTYCSSPKSYPRAYLLHDRRGVVHYAYRMTLVMNPALGQYYGVQGTTWQNPPLLNSPSGTRFVNGKQLMLFGNGSKLSVVAWRTRQGVYWISNTLTDDLTNGQMIAIAASLSRAGGR
jgi:hypothetical protein